MFPLLQGLGMPPSMLHRYHPNVSQHIPTDVRLSLIQDDLVKIYVQKIPKTSPTLSIAPAGSVKHVIFNFRE